ncbi:ankyrin repeat domain-containing protein [Pseudomonas fulva]|nr:ankyrin repeat domain-containing protein [Pseudomonas fulva]MBF8778188.1 ankyrin repeat domain-containing protein [Pseudomonas fulva]
MNDSQACYADHQALLDRLYAAVEAGELEHVRAFATAHPHLLQLTRFGNPDAENLLHIAARHGQQPMCALLIDCGLAVDQPARRHGRATALELAASGGHVGTCQYLLEAGASVEGQPDSICGPLLAATVAGQREVVELLLRHGADVNRLHRTRNTGPLDAAVAWKHDQIAELLSAAGARHIDDIGDDQIPEAGNAILNFVQQTVGRVLPLAFSPVSEERRASLHVSLVASKNDFKLLFTLGQFQVRPMTELFICLPGDWALPRLEHEAADAWRFPARLLSRLTRRAFDRGPLIEGSLILRDDTDYADLAWPIGVDALLAVDKPWQADSQGQDIPEDEKVLLLTLAPVKFARAGVPRGPALAGLVERKRKASWKALALPMPA